MELPERNRHRLHSVSETLVPWLFRSRYEPGSKATGKPVFGKKLLIFRPITGRKLFATVWRLNKINDQGENVDRGENRITGR